MRRHERRGDDDEHARHVARETEEGDLWIYGADNGDERSGRERAGKKRETMKNVAGWDADAMQ